MTPRQRAAVLAPCARAWETLDPAFRELVRFKGESWSTILSVNK